MIFKTQKQHNFLLHTSFEYSCIIHAKRKKPSGDLTKDPMANGGSPEHLWYNKSFTVYTVN